MKKILPILLISIFFILFSWFLGIWLSRLGKFKVDISVAPSKSSVYIDNKKVAAGSVYVGKGTHTFMASFRDFVPDKKSINVQSPTSVSLLPSAYSSSSLQYLQANPSIQQERERLSGEQFYNNGVSLSKNYPFLDQLPILTSNFAVYKAASSFSANSFNENRIALEVVALNPTDRQRAIDRIRTELGVDPSTIEIIFDNENNIFVNKVVE
jgi:hypothetical protein